MDVAVWWAAVAVTAGTALTAGLFWAGADLWWPATLLLFGPRWLLLGPTAALAVMALLRDRLLLVPVAFSSWLVLGPIMGFDLGWRGWATRPDPSVDLTVVTLNMAGRVASEGPAGLMAEWNADVAALQECGYAFQRNLSRQGLEGWHVATGPTQCLLSRFEILERRTMERETLEAAGGSGLVASYLLAGPTGPFWLTSIHLETPRDGLSLIRYGQPIEGIRVLGQSARLRRIEHRQARRFVDALSGPRITVGDFNTPPESRYYREAWGDWTNAFSFAGFGFGGTRLSGWIRARIDHLVVDEAWEVVEARVGEHVGSDHLPVIAVLRPR